MIFYPCFTRSRSSARLELLNLSKVPTRYIMDCSLPIWVAVCSLCIQVFHIVIKDVLSSKMELVLERLRIFLGIYPLKENGCLSAAFELKRISVFVFQLDMENYPFIFCA